MKSFLLMTAIFFMASIGLNAQTTIALDGRQSMCITGKGQGQDGAINPYISLDKSYGIVENIGKNVFSVRIEKKGKIIDQIEVKPNEIKTIKLLKNQVMYFDSNAATEVRVDFKKTLS